VADGGRSCGGTANLDLQIDEKCDELKMPGDTSDYAVATPVTSAQGGEGLGAGGPEVGGGVVGSAAGWLMRVFGPVIDPCAGDARPRA
jgi:hypothetical protein